VLTADLVRAFRRGDTLKLREINPKMRPRVHAIAEFLVAQATEGVGMSRDDVLASMQGLELRAAEQKIADGLRKLVLDQCDFSMDPALDPPTLRAAVFTAATVARKADEDGSFDRLAVLAVVAEALEMTPEALEVALFADLKQAQMLRSFDPITAAQLVDRYVLGQSQAVLLRAVRVVATVSGSSTGAYRALFRSLKFRRLLYVIEAVDDGYRITIDGPHNLFSASSKYGLQLALVLPAIRACASWAIEADVRWGKERLALTFQHAGSAETRAVEDRLPDDVQRLVDRWKKLKSPWGVRRSTRILDLPGVGLCVPDLVFSHPDHGKVYLEVMGFWSRAAVWKRVDLVEAGLKDRVLFAVSQRLRVSEAVLGGEERGALYVYKGVMNARGVLAKLDGLVG
jgi:hypothetical protein